MELEFLNLNSKILNSFYPKEALLKPVTVKFLSKD